GTDAIVSRQPLPFAARIVLIEPYLDVVQPAGGNIFAQLLFGPGREVVTFHVPVPQQDSAGDAEDPADRVDHDMRLASLELDKLWARTVVPDTGRIAMGEHAVTGAPIEQQRGDQAQQQNA